MNWIRILSPLRWFLPIASLTSCGSYLASGRGCEDLVTFPDSRIVTGSRKDGTLYSYRHPSKTLSFRPLTTQVPDGVDFRPLALDVHPRFPAKGGKQKLYVLSVGKKPSILIFEEKDRTLVAGTPIELPSGIKGIPNAMLVLPDGRILVTFMGNNPFVRTGAAREASPEEPWQENSIISYDPRTGRFRNEIVGLAGANGIHATANGKGIVVSQYYGKCLAYLRDENSRLRIIHQGTPGELNIHPDNIKSLHPNRFEVAGQHHWLPAGLSVFLCLPVSSGDSFEFVWDGSDSIPDLKGLSRYDLHRGDYRGPSAAITVNGILYVGHAGPRGIWWKSNPAPKPVP